MDRSLEAIEHACAGLAVEVLVVRPLGRPPLPSFGSVSIREIVAAEETLVPDRWGQGIQVAQAPVVACLTSELIVSQEWARVLIAALNGVAVGAAGAIGLSPGSGMTATAVYLVRFSAFLPGRGTGSHSDRNIPGDSAAYRRDPVMAHPDLLSAGFWEAEFHRRFHADGSRLILVDDTLSLFRSSVGLRTAMQLRKRHGHGFGMTRVRQHGESPMRVILAAPAVPVVLLVRVLRRAAGSPGAVRIAIRALPALAMLCAAWAWGEASGAWAARTRA